MKVISAKKSNKETTLSKLTHEMTTLDGERNTLKDEIGVLDSEKSKLMNAANDYTQEKSALDAKPTA